jgi:predicted TIM-barrel fold metal-dependent hydrolase
MQERGSMKKAIVEFLEIAGGKKLLFGTDFPISDQKSYVEVVRELGMGLTPALLLYNTKQAFKLPA